MNIIMYVKVYCRISSFNQGKWCLFFVICHNKIEDEDELKRELNDLVNKIVGPIASFR